ncbi:MAG: LecA/PA-IL family lectin [Planctomycetota bacterium]
MTAQLHLGLYPLADESMDITRATPDDAIEHQAVAEWRTTVEGTAVASYYYNNVSVSKPYQLLNDSNNKPIWVIEALYTFSDVAWRYAHNGEVIHDFCGKRGQIDSSFTCKKANIFQLVPALREKGGTNVCFVNNGCYNPCRIEYGIGGRLMVIPNDRRGTYNDNSGSFDVKVTVVKPLP